MRILRFLLILLFAFIVEADSAGVLISSGLTKEQQDVIVEMHNSLRSSLALGNYVAKGVQQPPASNMKKLKWSDEVAKSAQDAANICIGVHTTNRMYGENIYASSTAASMPIIGKLGCEWWQNEFQLYGIMSLNFSQEVLNSGIGHATNMAWAETEEVGCGAAICEGLQWPIYIYCQYNIGGNYFGRPVYIPGTTCSKCPTGFSCETNTGLCVRTVQTTTTSPVSTTQTRVSVATTTSTKLPTTQKPIITTSSTVKLVSSGFDLANKAQILKTFNDWRSSMAKGTYYAKGVKQPMAANMKKLKWSDDLALSAQLAANRCSLDHTKTTDKEGIYTYDLRSLSNISYYAAAFWKNGFDNYASQNDVVVSTWFPMIWAETEEIGCGASICDGVQYPGILFCHYSNCGTSQPGTPIYQVATTCSMCGVGFNCETGSGLCIRGVLTTTKTIHTTLKPSTLTSPAVTLVSSGFSPANKAQILQTFNDWRSSLAKGIYYAKGVKQPMAANMKKLKWSDDLALSAQLAANRCSLDHTKTTDKEGIYTYDLRSLSNISYYAAAFWKNGFDNYASQNDVVSSWFPMIWAETEEIGCGASICDGVQYPGILFCHYSNRATSAAGTPIFQVGATCSKCRIGFICEQSSGLCIRN